MKQKKTSSLAKVASLMGKKEEKLELGFLKEAMQVTIEICKENRSPPELKIQL